MAILTTKPKDYKTGDAVTAKVINDTIDTAIEAYRMVAMEVVKASPIDWEGLTGAFDVNGNGELILNYEGDGTHRFYLVEDNLDQNYGHLMLEIDE